MSSNIDFRKLPIKETVSFTWTIENLSTRTDYVNSPDFHSPSNENINIFLGFYPSSGVQHWEDYSSVCLYCHGDLSIVYSISLINSSGHKVCTQECNAKFEHKYSVHSWHYFIANTFLMDPKNELLTDDKLTIYCEVSIFDGDTEPMNSYTEDVAQISRDFGFLLENEKLSDLILSVEKKEFRVHKSILGARSPVFCAMFEHECEEKKQNRIEIADLSVEVCEQLLRYIYTGKVGSLEEYALELFIAADKYQLDLLKHICGESLSGSMSIETISNVLAYADMHNEPQLKSKCIQFITQNCTQVMQTDGWKQLGVTRPELLMELYQDIATKAQPFLKK